MKKLLFFILLAPQPAWYLQAQHTPEYPRYSEVVTHFFNRYDMDEDVYTPLTVFEKRPTGWWVKLYTARYKDAGYYQLWKSEDGSYTTPGLRPLKVPGKRASDITLFLDDTYRHTYYDMEPYYGYVGWTDDVIRIFGKRDKLSDSLLYGLANAYSLYASDLLTNNSGLADPQKMFSPAPETGLILASELATYREYRHKAISLMEELSRRNPDFQTLVGPVRLKYWNEVVVAFWDVWEYYGEEEALKELKPDLYNDFYLNLAANQLASCPKNAILFSAGDTDTFPLLYMQVQKGFRPDVRLVNISLYQTPHYANALRRPFFGAEPLPFGLTPEETADPRFEYVLLERSYDPLKIADIPLYLQEEHPVSEKPEFRFTFPSYSFWYNDKLTLSASASYLLRNDLLFLNLLRVNNEQRPLCFTVSNSNYMQAGSNMSLTGLVLQLQYDKAYYYRARDTEAVYNLLMKGLRTGSSNPLKALEARSAFPYTFGFFYLAESLLDKGDKKRTEQLLDRYFNLFGEMLPAADPWNLSMIELYYKTSAFTKGNERAALMAQSLEQNPGAQSESTLAELRRLMERYKQPAISTRNRK